MPRKKKEEGAEDERARLLKSVWGNRGVRRLNSILDTDFCGVLTVREFVAIVLADNVNFPRGIDTNMSIGDFEGNYWTDVLGVTTGGRFSDHVCITGDFHG